jgi:hypothetical protein
VFYAQFEHFWLKIVRAMHLPYPTSINYLLLPDHLKVSKFHHLLILFLIVSAQIFKTFIIYVQLLANPTLRLML